MDAGNKRRKLGEKVNWRLWGLETFKEAQKKNLPIFLLVGYNTSTRCHVVDVTSFEDDCIIKLLNDSFVCIKVDRHERPDITKVCLTKMGDFHLWPVCVFLSYDREPYMHFLPYPLSSFESLLSGVVEIWEDPVERFSLVYGGVLDFKRRVNALPMSASLSGLHADLPKNALLICVEELASRWHWQVLRSASKFPRPVEIQLMLYCSKKMAETCNAITVLETLQFMQEWSIHDHIRGGFHSIDNHFCITVARGDDEYYVVPDFEKMLYDQGQLASVYLDAFSLTKDLFYSRVARDILDFLSQNMIGTEGQIFSAVDADSSGESEGFARKKEGAFYQWTTSEVNGILGKHDATLFMDHYKMKHSGNCVLQLLSDPHKNFKGMNVLIGGKEIGVDENFLCILAKCRKKLSDARSDWPKRHLDKKVIVSWNGLAISSLARASRILKSEAENTKFHFPVDGCDPEKYMEVAKNAASYIWKSLYNDQEHTLPHSFKSGQSESRPGFLADYAFLISGLLDLFEYGGGINWLRWAIKLQETQDKLFLDDDGGYFNTTSDGDSLVFLRVKEGDEGEVPSGNSVSAINLVRLASMMSGSGFDYYRKNAEHLLVVFEKRLKDMPVKVPLMCCAADMLISLPCRERVVVVGPKSSVEFGNMLNAAHASYNPNRTVIPIDPEDKNFWERNNSEIVLVAKDYLDSATDKVAAYVWKDGVCSHNVTVTDPDSLEAMLSNS